MASRVNRIASAVGIIAEVVEIIKAEEEIQTMVAADSITTTPLITTATRTTIKAITDIKTTTTPISIKAKATTLLTTQTAGTTTTPIATIKVPIITIKEINKITTNPLVIIIITTLEDFNRITIIIIATLVDSIIIDLIPRIIIEDSRIIIREIIIKEIKVEIIIIRVGTIITKEIIRGIITTAKIVDSISSLDSTRILTLDSSRIIAIALLAKAETILDIIIKEIIRAMVVDLIVITTAIKVLGLALNRTRVGTIARIIKEDSTLTTKERTTIQTIEEVKTTTQEVVEVSTLKISKHLTNRTQGLTNLHLLHQIDQPQACQHSPPISQASQISQETTCKYRILH